MHAFVEVTFSAFQAQKVPTQPLGLLELSPSAISLQLLLLPLSSLLPGPVQTSMLTPLLPKGSAPFKDQSAATSRASTSQMLVKKPISISLLQQVKLAPTRLDPSRDSLPSNPLILLDLKSKTSTMTTMISKTIEECSMEARREEATKLKNRERAKDSKLSLKLPDLIAISLFLEMALKIIMEQNLKEDPKSPSSTLLHQILRNSREETTTSQSLLRRLDTSRSLSLLLET